MALTPLILIFLEAAQVSATPETPDLNSVIVGPAYDVLDYQDDGDQVLLTSAYGQLESGGAYAPPVSGTDAIVVLDGGYPAQSAGAKVDHASVRFQLRAPRVILGSTHLNGSIAPVLGTYVTTTADDRTLIALVSPTANFVTAGVQPGDRIVLTSTLGQVAVRTVASVGEPDADGLVPSGSETLLRVTQQLPAPNGAASGSITFPAGADLVDGETFTLNDGINSATVFEFDSGGGVTGANVAIAFTGVETATQIRDLARTAINAVGAGLRITASNLSSAGLTLVNDVGGEAGNQLITDTVADTGFTSTGMSGGTSTAEQWTYNSLGECRVERLLGSQPLSDPGGTLVTFPEPGSDKLVVRGGVTVSTTITPAATVSTPSPSPSLVTRAVSYAQLYLSYRALRQDLQRLNRAVQTDQQTVAGIPVIRGIGKYDARNPLAVGVKLALDNAGNNPIFYWGVSADDSTGYANSRARLAGRGDVYCSVALTQDINIHAAYNASYVQSADPTHARDKGVLQRFRMHLGSVPLPVAATVYEGSISGVSQLVSAALTNRHRTVSIAAASTGSVGVRSVLPGDSVTIGLARTGEATWLSRKGTHLVSHVNSSKDYPLSGDPSSFEVQPNGSRWDDAATSASDDIEIVIKGPDGSVKVSNLAEVAISTGSGGTLGTVRYAMRNPTITGGPYTIVYVASGQADTNVAITIVGFVVTITLGSLATHTQLAAAVNAHAGLSALLAANVTAGGGVAVIPASQAPSGAVPVVPLTGSCVANVVLNDALFNQLEDASATFLAAGIRPGDSLEIPLDPNNYGPTNYDGRVLRFTVGTVLNENRLRIANGFDDEATLARELPHFFSRDLPDRFIDNVSPNALAYRVRRTLSADDQVTTLMAISQSVRSKRLAIMWPDRVGVSDLRDGSLPRSLPAVRTLAGTQPSWALACAVAGVIAGTPAQMGLTNGSFIGFDSLENSGDVFSPEQLSQISDGGYFLCTQEAEGALPECLHQLTTDPSTLETGEVSVVKNIDFIAIFFQQLLKRYLGKYNNIPEALNEIYRSVSDSTELLKGRFIARIGPPLLSGNIVSLAPSESAADTVEMFYEGKVPRPLNNIAFHLVVQK